MTQFQCNDGKIIIDGFYLDKSHLSKKRCGKNVTNVKVHTNDLRF